MAKHDAGIAVTARISEAADLKLRTIEAAMAACAPAPPGASRGLRVRRPDAIEAAILAADPVHCARLHAAALGGPGG